ncbi:hypothetical protein D3C87_603590 [compost metagenome]
MDLSIKKATLLFVFSFYIFSFKSYSQTLLVPSQDSRENIEQTILKEIDFQKDTLQLKKYLAPLEKSSSKKFRVLYYALLANGYSHFFDDTNSKSNKYYQLSIQKAKETNDASLLIWAQMNYSKYLYYYREMDKLIPIVLKTIDDTNKINPEKMIFPGETFKLFGWIMLTVEDDDLTIYYLKKSLLYTKVKTAEYASILNAIGHYYFKKEDLVKATYYFDKTIKLSLSINDTLRYAKALGDKALVYEKRGDLKSAIQLLQKDINYSEKLKSEKNSMYAYVLMTKMLLKNQDTVTAQTLLRKAEKIAVSKPYYANSLKEIIELNLIILNNKDPEKELLLRREIEGLDDYLLKTDGDVALNRVNWVVQKNKYEHESKNAKLQYQHETKMKNIYVFVIILVILFSFLIFISLRKRLKNNTLEYDKKIMGHEIEKLTYEKKLNDANQNLDSYTNYLHNKNVQVSKLKTELEEIKKSKSYYLEVEKGKLQELLDSHLMTEENWINFKREFTKEYPQFYRTLMTNFPELKDSNLKIIMLQKLQFNNSEIANLLGITLDAVKKSKQRLKKKLAEKYDLLFEIIDKP